MLYPYHDKSNVETIEYYLLLNRMLALQKLLAGQHADDAARMAVHSWFGFIIHF